MKKKKGFTLIELLAVIVILAIIALIAIPLIGNVIEKAKIGALESSVNGLVESANMYYANNTIKGETITETIFDFEDGEQVSDKKLEYKGKVYNGKLILHANGEVAVCIDDEEHYAYKNKDTDEIVSGNGTCLYNGTTGDFSSNSSINDLRGKTVVATDISQSADGLSTLIKIPEEGHYDKNSIISVLNSELDSNERILLSSTSYSFSSSSVIFNFDVSEYRSIDFDLNGTTYGWYTVDAYKFDNTSVRLYKSGQDVSVTGHYEYDVSDYSKIVINTTGTVQISNVRVSKSI